MKRIKKYLAPRNNDPKIYADFLRERIYGTITLTAVTIGLLSEVSSLSVSSAFSVVASSIFGLWTASCFAEYVSYRVIRDQFMPKKDITHMLAAHRGIIVSGLPSLIMIGVAWLDIVSLRTALLIDIVIATSAMAVVILRSSNTQHNSFKDALIMIAMQTGIALFIIRIKLFG